MPLAAQEAALLLTEHVLEPFAGPVLVYGTQAVNVAYDGALWMLESLGLRADPSGMIEPPPGDTSIDVAQLVKLLGLGDSQTLDVDLNEAVPADLIGRFGLIIDAGTMEHVFDIRQGMKNTADMLRPGGRVVHMSAVNNYVNNGLVQLSPTLFHDYYVENGFDDVRGIMMVQPRAATRAKRWNFFQYEHATMGGVNSMFCSSDTQLAVYFTARKNLRSTSERVPMQSYFTRLSEGKDAVPYQFVVTHDRAQSTIRQINDSHPQVGEVQLFGPIWAIEL